MPFLFFTLKLIHVKNYLNKIFLTFYLKLLTVHQLDESVCRKWFITKNKTVQNLPAQCYSVGFPQVHVSSSFLLIGWFYHMSDRKDVLLLQWVMQAADSVSSDDLQHEQNKQSVTHFLSPSGFSLNMKTSIQTIFTTEFNTGLLCKLVSSALLLI